MKQSYSKISKKIKISLDKISEIKKEIKNILEFKEKIKELLSQKILETTKIVEIIIGGGINLGTSDIHIEAEEEQAKIRIRLDGMLYDVINISPKIYQFLLSRIKLLSGIKLNIRDRPQDGRFSIIIEQEVVEKNIQELIIEVRVSTIPSEYGESIVLRILNPKSLLELEELGLRKDLLSCFEKEIKKPNGMIIVTGPTGSGKTTTLYAFLKKIQKPEIKIITIEDPIEYHLKGISQTQIAPEKGYDFANGLRAIVRQDPDAILIGEIRDLETAKIALQSALTGHLVFTTLHTNDAAGTIVRLINLGADPISIGPALNMIVAQRLTRKVCQDCFNLVPPTLENFKKIEKIKSILKKINFPLSFKKRDDVKIPQIQGCKNCNFTGYKGRIGIYESLLIDTEIEQFILTSPSISALRELAVKKGMVSMYQDGLIKVLEGITTIEEIERVTKD